MGSWDRRIFCCKGVTGAAGYMSTCWTGICLGVCHRKVSVISDYLSTDRPGSWILIRRL
eukprot:CAMPEP_0194735688 /NCGR_PEP_ID=MMETSP0296-20130528/74520_1 /TAXON_ID=39354 /ORGANISM="Heterosigma akashiwo, Strain CCMP2393" /LENGTH=58 /DNA_ID=CAMNT_0039644967 /DNA_START=24 /DNA_END=197 /DNA_ORIENTATION=-